MKFLVEWGNNLILQSDKCEFLRKEVSYLGHVVGPTWQEAVKDFPEPKPTRELKGFLGLAGYYRRFVPNFNKLAKLLAESLKNVPYDWNEKAEAAFVTLKMLWTTEPLLHTLTLPDLLC